METNMRRLSIYSIQDNHTLEEYIMGKELMIHTADSSLDVLLCKESPPRLKEDE